MKGLRKRKRDSLMYLFYELFVVLFLVILLIVIYYFILCYKCEVVIDFFGNLCGWLEV